MLDEPSRYLECSLTTTSELNAMERQNPRKTDYTKLNEFLRNEIYFPRRIRTPLVFPVYSLLEYRASSPGKREFAVSANQKNHCVSSSAGKNI